MEGDMKAAVLQGPSNLVVQDVAVPEAGPREVLIKMGYCGICGSDLHYFESELTPPGSIMGHEWVGSIVELGEGVTKWSVGDRVWPGTLHEPDWEWKPEYGWDLGARMREASPANLGGYGEYAVYHQDSIVRVPESVSDIEAVMADPAGTALAGVQAARLMIGESVLVIGAGPIGLWVLRVSQLAGARKICLAEVLHGRAEHARRRLDCCQR
jgi:threonine dehydrogenase-like Zn-dependent dehydrogenase